MHPQTVLDFVTWRQQALLDEATRAQLAATARACRPRPRRGGASPLRRLVAWALIHLGVWLADGSLALARGREVGAGRSVEIEAR